MAGGSAVIARQVSPDGEFTLVIEKGGRLRRSDHYCGALKKVMGWHFHPTEDEALRIATEVIADRVVIFG